MALRQSAFPGTIMILSPFIWADRLLGHRALNHVRKSRLSVTPAMKIIFLLGRSHWGRTLAQLAPAGVPPRCPDISSQDMHLIAVSKEAAGSEVT